MIVTVTVAVYLAAGTLLRNLLKVQVLCQQLPKLQTANHHAVQPLTPFFFGS